MKYLASRWKVCRQAGGKCSCFINNWVGVTSKTSGMCNGKSGRLLWGNLLFQ